MCFIGLSSLDLSRPLLRRFSLLLSRLIRACSNVACVRNPAVAKSRMKLVGIVCYFQPPFGKHWGEPIVNAAIVLHLDLGDLHLVVEAYDNTLTVRSR